MMPMLFSLGQQGALDAIQARLRPGERLFAFLDDIYAVSAPERTVAIYKIIEEELWRHARIRVNIGKTQVWNQSGKSPEDIEEVGRRAWRGDESLPPEQRGIRILGTPLGHPRYVQQQLRELAEG